MLKYIRGDSLDYDVDFSAKVIRYLGERKQSNEVNFSNKNKLGRSSFGLLNVFMVFMKIASLELKESDGRLQNGKRRILNLLECIDPCRKGEMKLMSRIFHSFLYIFSTYGSIKLLILALISYLRDYEFSKWKQTHRNNTTNCPRTELASSNQDYSSLDIDYFGHVSLTTLMRLIGSVGTTSLGILSVSEATLGSGLFFSFVLSIILVYYNNYRVDVLNFIENPLEESMRIHQELTEIMSSIIKHSLSVGNENINPSSSSIKSLGAKKVSFLGDSTNSIEIKQISRIQLKINSITIDKLMEEDNNDDRNKGTDLEAFIQPRRGHFHGFIFYNRIFSDIMSYSLVKPAILTKQWHDWLSNYSVKFIYFTCFLTYLYCSIVCVVGCYTEIDARLKQRLYQLQHCPIESTTIYSRQGINLIEKHQEHEHRRDFEQLEPLSPMDAVHFINFNRGFTGDYLKLFLIEIKYYLTLRMILNWLELFILCLTQTSNVTFYFCLHSLSHLDRLTWINQIIKQIDRCIGSTIKLSNSFFYVNDGDKYQLSTDLTVAYLNYGLFIKQQKAFQKLSSFLVYQGGPCLVVLPLTYLTAINVKTDSVLIMLLTSTYIVSYMNFYLLHTAILTNKIEKLRVNILRLLAYSQMCPYLQENSHILELWRQHLATQIEYRKLYSPKFFGFHLSYDKLFTLNIYFIVLIAIVVANDKIPI